MEFEKLKQIIADVLNVDPEEITMSTTFMDDLGADSLDMVEFVMVLEEEFDIEIENDAYNVIILTCQYFITVNGDTSYSVEMTYSMKYTYGKDREIMAPSF